MNLLIRIIPPPLVRFFAKPYVSGDSLEKALDACAELAKKRGLLSSLDLLAEDIETDAQCKANLDVYFKMVDRLASDPRFADAAARPTVSMKPSSYTTKPLDKGGDGEGAEAALFAIAERAKERGVRCTIDMESRHWTDFTLDVLKRMQAKGLDNVGGVLQTLLNRTEADIEALPEGLRIRMVIGIYREPEEIATTDKKEMKRRLLVQAERLLNRGHFVEFATHDEAVVRTFVDEIIPRTGVGPDRYEVQMLYGVPRPKLLAELVDRGISSRLYVPFALSWGQAIQYLRRRLDEYPKMMWLVLKNMFWRK